MGSVMTLGDWIGVILALLFIVAIVLMCGASEEEIQVDPEKKHKDDEDDWIALR